MTHIEIVGGCALEGPHVGAVRQDPASKDLLDVHCDRGRIRYRRTSKGDVLERLREVAEDDMLVEIRALEGHRHGLSPGPGLHGGCAAREGTLRDGHPLAKSLEP